MTDEDKQFIRETVQQPADRLAQAFAANLTDLRQELVHRLAAIEIKIAGMHRK